MKGLLWWIDRWRQSQSYTDMTLEEQGAYRNLLDEATLRGGALPNDDRVLAKASGDALKWKRLRTTVMTRFELREDGWHNTSLDKVLREGKRRADKQAKYRRGNGRGNASGNEDGNNDGNKPPPVTGNVTVITGSGKSVGTEHPRSTPPASRHGKHPAHKGQHLTVFDWMLWDLRGMLGTHADAFALDEWFYELDAMAAREPGVVRDRWKWIQEKTLAEAERRGLPAAGQATKATRCDYCGQTHSGACPRLPTAWQCVKCGEVHEGAQAQRGQCLKQAV